MILLSTSGTRLIARRPGADTCTSLPAQLARAGAWMVGRHERVVVLGRGHPRRVPRGGSALRGPRRALLRRGYRPADTSTAQVIERFGDAPDDAFLGGRSATYLRTRERT